MKPWNGCLERYFVASSRMCDTCIPLKVSFTRPHAKSCCPVSAGAYCSSCACYGHTCIISPPPCPIKISRTYVSEIQAKPVFEIGWNSDEKLYKEILCAFLNSQSIKYSIEEFDDYFGRATTKLNKIKLLEMRIDDWAKENGYSHADFIGKPK